MHHVRGWAACGVCWQGIDPGQVGTYSYWYIIYYWALMHVVCVKFLHKHLQTKMDVWPSGGDKNMQMKCHWPLCVLGKERRSLRPQRSTQRPCCLRCPHRAQRCRWSDADLRTRLHFHMLTPLHRRLRWKLPGLTSAVSQTPARENNYPSQGERFMVRVALKQPNKRSL